MLHRPRWGGWCKGALVGLVFLAAITAFLRYTGALIVWPPDLLREDPIALATFALEEGDAFTLTQEWNGGDFYTTRFTHTTPDGRQYGVLVDPDAPRIWDCGIRQSEDTPRVVLNIAGQPRMVYLVDQRIARLQGGDSVVETLALQWP